MGYTQHALKGVSWIGGIRVVIRSLTFVKTIIIARILSPFQFGLFGIATLVLSFIEILTETGINVFLVQHKAAIDEYVSTAWLVSIIRGIVISIVIAVSSPFVAAFFHAPDALGLLVLMSIVPLIRGCINPANVNFQKELLFRKEFSYRSTIFLVETAFSIVFVLWSQSIFGLVWAMIAGALFEVALSFAVIKPRPKFVFEKQRFFEVIGFGKWLTASGILNYFYQHGDDIAIGRILGTGALGLYDMAYRISLAPLTDIADVIAKVTFPVYVKIGGDTKRLQAAFLKTLVMVVLCVAPVSVLLFLFPEEIITIILGEQWIGAAAVLQVLAIFGLIRAVSVFSSTLFLAVKQQHIVTLVSLVGFSGLLLTIIPFIMWWGIVGAGLAALFGTALTLPVISYNLYKLFQHPIHGNTHTA